MLSLALVTPALARKYYSIENFTKIDRQSLYHSRWAGEGASALGLSGRVDPEVFTDLIDGKLPDGTVYRHRRETEEGVNRRIAGVDLTFSAPKSVSLLALVKRKWEIAEAHHAAVANTLETIEREYAFARVTIDGRRHRVATGNLIVARFNHQLSRELDPQLHTHCVTLNATYHDDRDRWYALETFPLFLDRNFLGQVYRNYLSTHLTDLGFELAPRTDGLFELAEFDPDHLDAFSRRRQQIRPLLSPGMTAPEKQAIVIDTRKTKPREIDIASIREDWRARAAGIGWKCPPFYRPPLRPPVPDLDRRIGEITVGANDGVTISGLRRDLLKSGLGTCTIGDIDRAIALDDSLLVADTRIYHRDSPPASVKLTYTSPSVRAGRIGERTRAAIAGGEFIGVKAVTPPVEPAVTARRIPSRDRGTELTAERWLVGVSLKRYGDRDPNTAISRRLEGYPGEDLTLFEEEGDFREARERKRRRARGIELTLRLPPEIDRESATAPVRDFLARIAPATTVPAVFHPSHGPGGFPHAHLFVPPRPFETGNSGSVEISRWHDLWRETIGVLENLGKVSAVGSAESARWLALSRYLLDRYGHHEGNRSVFSGETLRFAREGTVSICSSLDTGREIFRFDGESLTRVNIDPSERERLRESANYFNLGTPERLTINKPRF